MQVVFEKVESKEQEIALIKAVEKTSDIQSAIDLLENGINSISVTKDGITYMCKINAVYYIESVDKRTYIYTKNDCFETKSRLYELEEKLGTYFARCSKAMIVNLKKIRNVRSELGGRLNAEMLNGEKIVISRSYVKDIKRRMDL
ncbi:LytTR family DNA-binding domain-containing protein [Acetivibrio mesophilus]|uniref:LytTR family transcriptional regulator n=1 Tax=Acetivibrio mesophilus TaxID=2487273 RepID=A0A4Q0I824_9FIRM|nr:LytTR family DNA-binding domain-containing protein [Acetivibrio mesophilus]ODM26354.1 histidine kinase [Clostridium sp. Bc-iso-3]RXE60586.1 LytTR family transcriptional regulator [Acetivibrio mesophilus]HHV30352.1 LytTR family transcriptional regulator [Clostridium sp.]